MSRQAVDLRAAVVILAALAAAGCAGLGAGGTGPGGSSPATVGLIGARPAEKSPAAAKPAASSTAAKAAPAQKTSAGDEALQKAVTLISSATPASLAAARWVAADASREGTRDAGAAGSVADALLRALYPEAAGAGGGSGAAGPLPSAAQINDPFLQRVAPALNLLDPRAAIDDAKASELRQKLAEAAQLRPESPLPPYLAGVLLQRSSGRPAEARAQLEEALKLVPTFAPAAAELLNVIIASGTAPKELPLLQHLASIPSTAAERFEALARADLAAGQPGMAADAAARGLLESPDDGTGAAQRVHFALLRATALEASGDWYQALSVLDALLKLEPGLPVAALAKARILHEKGENNPDALAVLADGEARNPQDAALPEMEARILLDDGRTGEAMTALQRAHQIDPRRSSVLTLLVSVSARAGKWDDAASWLEQIPVEARGPEQVRLAWQIATARGDHEKALAEAKRLFQATGSVDAIALEARSMIAADRPADARVVIDHALLAMRPAPPQASELYYLRSRAGSDDPLRDLRTALRQNPDNPEALEAISDALAAQKDYRRAMEYARRASSLDPANTALSQKAKELQKMAAAESPAAE